MTTAGLKKIVHEFLDTHKKGVMATVDESGQPHTSLMLYASDDDFNIYFGTRKSFSKYGQLLKHSLVSLSVVEEKLDPLRVVDMRGVAKEIPHEETKAALAHFKSKNMSKYFVADADDFVMFKIEPTSLRWLDATSGELKVEPIDLN